MPVLKKMRFLLAVISQNLKATAQYSKVIITEFIANLLLVSILYAFWSAIARSGDIASLGYKNIYDLTTYIILANTLSGLMKIYLEYVSTIVQGNFIIHLIKPYSIFVMEGTSQFAIFISRIFTFLLPTIVVAILFLNFQLPNEPVTLLGFTLLIFSGFFVMLTFNIMYNMLAFLTTNAWGLFQLHIFVVGFFSGTVVPLSFFPPFLRVIADYLPFRTVISMPINYYLSGDVNLLIKTLFLQGIWSVIHILIAYIIWMKVIRKHLTILGG